MIKTNITKLVPPCSYQGGKQRIAKEIVDYILDTTFFTNNTKFYDMCCGSGAITIELLNRGIPPEKIVMCDKSSWGVFWKSIGDGSFDLNKFYTYSKAVPRDKSLIQNHMKELSQTNADIDEAYKYILLQASSFGGKQIWNTGGKWQNTSFRNYWQPTETSKRRSPVNPMQPMIDIIEKRVKDIINNCKGLTCYHKDIYEMLSIIRNDKSDYQIIYIDPPYTNTTGYGFNFDIHDFLSNLFDVTLGAIFVSEKESISDDEAIRLHFNGDKGGISGNKVGKNEEWLNVFR
jgi:site-specific DNA-adenine methylase